MPRGKAAPESSPASWISGRRLLSCPQGHCALGGRRPLSWPRGCHTPKGPRWPGSAREPPLRQRRQAGTTMVPLLRWLPRPR
jgi:hypothetical protein